MPSITFDLETVTPLFLSGANQQEAELRPPAFRGALRYWFRAIAASITTFDQVKNWENKIFGSTDAGGSVIIRVQAEKPTSIKSFEKYNASPSNNPWSGFEYLFFSIYTSGSKKARAYIPPERKFRVILQVRPLVADNLKCLKLAAGAMWCLINLGGIGSRSNRGGGSLKINNSECQGVDIDSIEFILNSMTLSDVVTEIGSQLQIVKNLFQSILTPVSTISIVTTEFDVISSTTSSLYLWHSGKLNIDSGYDKLLNEFGKIYKNFRSRYKISTGDDYIQVKEWIKTKGQSNVNTVKRAAFGLPIQFYFTSLSKPHNTASLEASQDIKRIASPFHIKVIALVNGQFAILLIHFKTQLLPATTNYKLILKNKSFKGSVRISVPNQDIIEEFINTLGNLPRVTLP
jgi:CRISPR-associated protein Cmr1